MAQRIDTIARGLVIGHIATCPDPRTKRERICIARRTGHLSRIEAREWWDIAKRDNVG